MRPPHHPAQRRPVRTGTARLGRACAVGPGTQMSCERRKARCNQVHSADEEQHRHRGRDARLEPDPQRIESRLRVIAAEAVVDHRAGSPDAQTT